MPVSSSFGRKGFAALLLIAVLLFTSGGAPASSAGAAADEVTASSGHTLTTLASPGFVLGMGTLADTATLAGAVNPTGTISFALFGPDDATCSGTAIFGSMATVIGNGTYVSGAFTPTTAGTYRWIAFYSGDANNTPVGSPCNAPNESVVVARLSPTITTTASPNIFIGAGTLTDTAVLTGSFNPSGAITFNLYGPNDATCSGPPVFNSTHSVSGMLLPIVTSSPPFSPTLPGTYFWVASYSGDQNNNPVTSACGLPGETVVVSQFATTLTTLASADILIGTGTLSDTATLGGGLDPTGTITFSLYGPNDATCSGAPAFTSVVPVAGASAYLSAPFTPSQAGTYRWIAAYSGDFNDAPATTACGDPNETVTVSQVATTVTTTASPGIVQGSGTVTDTANLSGGADPTGSITFNLYGPDDATCSGPPVFISVVPVSGNGTYVSAAFAPVLAGTYRWVARYSGDFNDAPATTACNDPDETVVVTAAAVPPAPAAPAEAPAAGGPLSPTRLASAASLPVTGMDPLRSLQVAAALLLFGGVILLATPRATLAQHTPRHRRRAVARYTPQHRRTRPGQYTPRHRRR